MLVAIDGPAGAGKSTVARAVADALGFTYLDTGAMYRCVGLVTTRALDEPGRPDVDPAEVAARIGFEGDRVLLGAEDVTETIRTPQAAQAASRVATDPAVRQALVDAQRRLIEQGDWVAEGRDIGTVVAPDAEVKVWLDADPAERARRREVPLEDVLERDRRDRERDHSPMVAADDAQAVDTTGMTIDDVVAAIVRLVEPVRDAR